MKYVGPKLRRRGYMLVEITMSIVLLMGIAVLSGKAVLGYYRTRDNHYWRQVSILAADGQLQRYRAGAELKSRPPEGTVPDEIILTTDVQPGQGQWLGFNRITVIASISPRHEREIREQIIGYIPAEVMP